MTSIDPRVKARELVAEARERAGYMTLLAKVTSNEPGAHTAREEAARMTRFADALEALLPGDEDREIEGTWEYVGIPMAYVEGSRWPSLSRGRDAEPEAVERTRKILNMLSLYADESNGAAYGTLNAAFVKAHVEEALAALGGLPVEEVPEHGE